MQKTINLVYDSLVTMKKKKLLLLPLLVLFFGLSFGVVKAQPADNVVSLPEVTAAPGENGSFPVNLDNQDEVGAFQMRFNYDATIGLQVLGVSTTGRTVGWTAAFAKHEADPSAVEVVVLLYNMSSLVIPAGTGPILEIGYAVGPGGLGATALQIVEVVLSSVDARSLPVSWQDGSFQIAGPTLTPTPAPLLGDVNGDKRVDFEDFLLVLSSWLRRDPLPEDINGDGKVNGMDAAVVIANFGAGG